jgi:hypothetical protein
MKLNRFIWLVPVALICYACPYESKVPLTPGPSEPVDSSLLGYWYGIVKDGSDFFGIEALDISKKSDSVYSITRYGKSIKGDIILPDTSYFTGYTTRIGEDRYMSVEGTVRVPSRKSPTGFDDQKIYYLSFIGISNDTLSIRTITENFTAKKDFRSPGELMLAITSLMQQQKNIFDDLYSLSYRKMDKPSR